MRFLNMSAHNFDCVLHKVSTIFWKYAYLGLNILLLLLKIKQVVCFEQFLLTDAEIDFSDGYIGVVKEF